MNPQIYPQLDQMGIPVIMIDSYAFQIAKEDIASEGEKVLITNNKKGVK